MEETFMIKQLMIHLNNTMTGQDDDYTTGCFLDFAYFEKNYRLIAADLRKQKALDSDPKPI